jgi:methylated-DNA-[protein]-cysteine S-methyltransferase
MTHYTLFETAIGWAGIAWTATPDGEQIIAAHLPETDRAILRRSFARRAPGATEADAPEALRPVIAGVQALMRGEKADLQDVALDLSRVPDFHARVYEVARAIPPGETLTYGEVAERLGDKLLARAVGEALGKNPWPILVPCHRVTAAGGKLGGFSARGGALTKLKLLDIEGARAAGQKDLFG